MTTDYTALVDVTEEDVLHELALALPFESWAEGKTLTVTVSQSPLRLAKLRFVGFTETPTITDLRGEPE